MRSLRRVLLYFPLFLVSVALAGLLWHRPLVLVALYVAISAVLLWKWHSPRDLVYYAVPFVLGPLGELFPVVRGAWTYSLADLVVPVWLPFVWGISGLFMRKTSEALAAPRPSALAVGR